MRHGVKARIDSNVAVPEVMIASSDFLSTSCELLKEIFIDLLSLHVINLNVPGLIEA